MELTQDWLSERFNHRWLNEVDDQDGMCYVKELNPTGDLALISSEKNGLEVILFPFEEIRFQTTEQIEAVYKAIKGETLKRL